MEARGVPHVRLKLALAAAACAVAAGFALYFALDRQRHADLIWLVFCTLSLATLVADLALNHLVRACLCPRCRPLAAFRLSCSPFAFVRLAHRRRAFDDSRLPKCLPSDFEL